MTNSQWGISMSPRKIVRGPHPQQMVVTYEKSPVPSHLLMDDTGLFVFMDSDPLFQVRTEKGKAWLGGMDLVFTVQ